VALLRSTPIEVVAVRDVSMPGRRLTVPPRSRPVCQLMPGCRLTVPPWSRPVYRPTMPPRSRLVYHSFHPPLPNPCSECPPPPARQCCLAGSAISFHCVGFVSSGADVFTGPAWVSNESREPSPPLQWSPLPSQLPHTPWSTPSWPP
jgi:hypothetical protein